jgi:hypothetical protein
MGATSLANAVINPNCFNAMSHFVALNSKRPEIMPFWPDLI